jgi:hypothetical protein
MQKLASTAVVAADKGALYMRMQNEDAEALLAF